MNKNTDAPWRHSARREDDWSRRVNYGNIEANKFFLESVDLLTPQQRILEVGCGKGTMLNELVNQGFNVVGCDVDPDLLAQSRALYGTLPVKLICDTRLPFDDHYFDVVLSFDVFEHIPDTDDHLREVTRVLRPGGYYLLQTPNKWTNSVFETIRWRSLTKWRKGHCSLHSYAQLVKRFAKHGFDVEYYRVPVVNEFFKRKIKRFLGAPGLIAIKVFNPDRLPLKLSTNFFVKATKLP